MDLEFHPLVPGEKAIKYIQRMCEAAKANGMDPENFPERWECMDCGGVFDLKDIQVRRDSVGYRDWKNRGLRRPTSDPTLLRGSIVHRCPECGMVENMMPALPEGKVLEFGKVKT